jgi:4-diphosphocytidyl-2C-methyl-D-erythritol kinase
VLTKRHVSILLVKVCPVRAVGGLRGGSPHAASEVFNSCTHSYTNQFPPPGF